MKKEIQQLIGKYKVQIEIYKKFQKDEDISMSAYNEYTNKIYVLKQVIRDLEEIINKLASSK